MRPRAHRHRAYLVRAEPACGGLAANEPHGALAVLPRALVDRQTMRTRSAVDEVDACHAKLRKTAGPCLDVLHVALLRVGAAGNENHADIRLAFGLRRGHPVYVGPAPFVRIEARRIRHVGHGRDLAGLLVGHATLGPQIHLLRQSGKCGKRRQ